MLLWGCGKAGAWSLERKPKGTGKSTAKIKSGRARIPADKKEPGGTSLGKENRRGSVGGPRQRERPQLRGRLESKAT